MQRVLWTLSLSLTPPPSTPVSTAFFMGCPHLGQPHCLSRLSCSPQKCSFLRPPSSNSPCSTPSLWTHSPRQTPPGRQWTQVSKISHPTPASQERNQEGPKHLSASCEKSKRTEVPVLLTHVSQPSELEWTLDKYLLNKLLLQHVSQ